MAGGYNVTQDGHAQHGKWFEGRSLKLVLKKC